MLLLKLICNIKVYFLSLKLKKFSFFSTPFFVNYNIYEIISKILLFNNMIFNIIYVLYNIKFNNDKIFSLFRKM